MSDPVDPGASDLVPKPTSVLGYRVVASYPHDVEAYTQGLAFDEGFLYEGTGLYGKSTLRQVIPETGEVVRLKRLPDDAFGEGIAVFHDTVIQMTERNGVVFLYDKRTLELVRTVPYGRRAWGLTHNGRHLITSDGSARLFMLDPESFETVANIDVHDDHGPVSNLNELEFIAGEIYANVIPTDRIVRISLASGRVLSWIDLSGLDRKLVDPPRNLTELCHSFRRTAGSIRRAIRGQAIVSARLRRGDVLNGIAYDTAGQRLFVTGKRWPKVFVIEALDKG